MPRPGSSLDLSEQAGDDPVGPATVAAPDILAGQDMRFSKPLLRLPMKFSAEQLSAEVRALPASAWTAHPQHFPGNSAVRLITAGGEATDAIEGAMGPTPYLLACPYMMQIMDRIGSVWGRSRLMALAPGGDVPLHVDSHYYWRTHIRIHIPVITNPGVSFTCGGESVHMAAGECWIFDSFLKHEVHNRGDDTRVHLVLDTVGGGRLHDLIETAETGGDEFEFVEPAGAAAPQLAFERVNLPNVMSPWEIRCHVDFIMSNASAHPKLDAVNKRIGRFIDDWAALWAQFGADERAVPRYGQLLAGVRRDLVARGAEEIRLRNEVVMQHIFDRLIVEVALQSARHPRPQAAGMSLRKAS